MCHEDASFHRTFVRGVEYQQWTLTPPDKWSRPNWDLHMFYSLRPFFLPNFRYFMDYTLYTFSTLSYLNKKVIILHEIF